MDKLLELVSPLQDFETLSGRARLTLLDHHDLQDVVDWRGAQHFTPGEWIASILGYMNEMLLHFHVVTVPWMELALKLGWNECKDALLDALLSEELNKYCIIQGDYISLKLSWENLQASQVRAGIVFTELGFEIPEDGEGWLTLTDNGKDIINQLGIVGAAKMLEAERQMGDSISKQHN